MSVFGLLRSVVVVVVVSFLRPGMNECVCCFGVMVVRSMYVDVRRIRVFRRAESAK